MKVSSYTNSPDFRGGLNNKFLLSGLEKISEHGASFATGVSLVSALALRPFAISITPNVDKKNKQYASSNSIASGIMKFAVAQAIILPIENAIKKIDKNPDKFLKKETINNLKQGSKTLLESRDYKFLTQSIKQSGNFLSAIPKSMLTVAFIPFLMDKIFKNKKKDDVKPIFNYDKVFEPVYNKIPFKGLNCKIASGIGKVINDENIQKFAKKFSKNDKDIARNMTVLTDIALTLSNAISVKRSKKIDENKKNPLIYNNLIATGASILMGVGVDKFVQKGQKNFVEKFKQVNKNDPKLGKYIEGLNILRPTLIFAFIYYGILPVVSTYMADKIDKKKNSNGLQGQ